jgi:hypothetical protein
MPSDNVCWRFTSPLLQLPEDELLTECPVGYVLREAPYIYDVLDYLCLGENLSPLELGKMPRYFAQMLRVYQNELARIRELKQIQHEANQHARIATGAVHG